MAHTSGLGQQRAGGSYMERRDDEEARPSEVGGTGASEQKKTYELATAVEDLTLTEGTGYYKNRYNMYDNKAQLTRFFQGDLLTELFIPYIGEDFLQHNGSLLHQLAYLASRGKIFRLNPKDAEAAGYTLAIANLIGHRLKNRCITDPEECRKEFRINLIYCVCMDQDKFYEVNETEYTGWTGKPAGAPTHWKDFCSENIEKFIADNTLTAFGIRDLVGWVLSTQNVKSRLRDIAPKLCVNAFVALCKRGSVNDGTYHSLNTTFEAEGVTNIVLPSDTILHIYQRINIFVDADNAEEIFTKWMKAIHLSLRCLLLLEQISHSGLTAFRVISQARKHFPTFKWKEVYKCIPADAANYVAAAVVINNNPYYGFNRDLGVASGTRYPSLAYVAKGLLIKYGGPDFSRLKNYKGCTKNIAFKSQLDRLIADFRPGALNDNNAAIQDSKLDKIDAAILNVKL